MRDHFSDTTVSIEQHDSGRVLVSQFGINGTVCRSGWDSTAASVLCQENGFRGGVVYSSSDELTRYEPIWVGSIKVRSFFMTFFTFYYCECLENFQIQILVFIF